jgi:hypothetical protein
LDVEPLGDEPFTVVTVEGRRHTDLISEGWPSGLKVVSRHLLSIW